MKINIQPFMFFLKRYNSVVSLKKRQRKLPLRTDEMRQARFSRAFLFGVCDSPDFTHNFDFVELYETFRARPGDANRSPNACKVRLLP